MPLPGGIWPSVKVWCGSFLKESLGQNARPMTIFRLNPQGLLPFHFLWGLTLQSSWLAGTMLFLSPLSHKPSQPLISLPTKTALQIPGITPLFLLWSSLNVSSRMKLLADFLLSLAHFMTIKDRRTLEPNSPGFESWHCQSLAVQRWVTCLSSTCLHSFICKML